MVVIKRNIPRRDKEFFTFQANLVNHVVANQVAWAIPPAAVTALSTRRAEFESLFAIAENKRTRTMGDVLAFRECRQTYEKELRVFIKAYLAASPLVTDEKRSEMALTIRKTKPSPRPQISDTPWAGLHPLGGGEIEIHCRRLTDKDRPSMHPDADAVEVRFILAPVGTRPPNDPEVCPRYQISRKAHFIILCGDQNAGQRFYGFFRWVNLTNPANSGPWSNAQTVVIA